MPFSSAVIRTKPLALGYHYSLEHGRTGMGGEDEYGLFPGQVKLHDIDCVMWVKDGSIVGTCPPDEAADVLGQAYEAAAKSCPRP